MELLVDYKALYDALVHKAKNRLVEGYVEQHHILPRSMGGSNDAENLVSLTAREHFLAHWLLFKVYRSKECALAFRLMLDAQGRRRGRDYAVAKEVYAGAMRGAVNPAKRPEVRAKIVAALTAAHPYRGIKRPQHAAKMKGRLAGASNPAYGMGARQVGGLNASAKAVRGVKDGVVKHWDTLTAASIELGVSLQAVFLAANRKGRSRGWALEYQHGR